jgi:hypothetical protein
VIVLTGKLQASFREAAFQDTSPVEVLFIPNVPVYLGYQGAFTLIAVTTDALNGIHCHVIKRRRSYDRVIFLWLLSLDLYKETEHQE